MKLAATRDVISRLDSITAVYDVRLDAIDKDGGDPGSVAGNPSAPRNTHETVSVEALKGKATSVAQGGDGVSQ
ncbi:MAG: hypothetical protein WBQ43_04355 [Terriglobales bacterium]